MLMYLVKFLYLIFIVIDKLDNHAQFTLEATPGKNFLSSTIFPRKNKIIEKSSFALLSV